MSKDFSHAYPSYEKEQIKNLSDEKLKENKVMFDGMSRIFAEARNKMLERRELPVGEKSLDMHFSIPDYPSLIAFLKLERIRRAYLRKRRGGEQSGNRR